MDCGLIPVRRLMIALADIIADELAKPDGHILQERMLQAMFMFERFRGIDAGWRDIVAKVAEADVSADAIGRLAQALRTFIVLHKHHPDVGSAIFALGKLYADEDAAIFEAVLKDGSEYDTFAREQAQCILDVIQP
jgi:hypothetical protein